MPTIEISKNDKYHEVIHGEYDFDEEPQSEEEFVEMSNYHEAAEAFLKEVGHIEPTPGALDPETPHPDAVNEVTPTWDDFSVASDPDLVAKMATYFGGMYPDEPTDRIRAKLRLLGAQTYIHAQLAAQAELRAN